MHNIGFVATLILGFAAGAATVGPCCWFAAKLHRAVTDRRSAWATHRGLLGTIWSHGLRAVALGASALAVLVILVAVQGRHSAPDRSHNPLPAMSSSAPGR
jgi:hypothetical protein